VLSQQLHLEAQASELVDQAPGARLWIQALEVVFAEFVVGLATRDDVVDDHEQRMRERYDGLLVPTPIAIGDDPSDRPLPPRNLCVGPRHVWDSGGGVGARVAGHGSIGAGESRTADGGWQT
jgi:hypothetical protein